MLDVDEMDEVEAEEGADGSQVSSRNSRRSSQQSGSNTQESYVSSHFSQREDSKVVKDRKDAGKVDFSSMDEDLKVRRSASEEEKLRKKFESKISKLSQEIEGIAPNMKVSFVYCS